jgi:hypothetical protein
MSECCTSIKINCKDFDFNIEEKDNSLIIHITSEDSDKIGKFREAIEKYRTFAFENCCDDGDDKGESKECC